MDLDEYRAEAEDHLRAPGPAADARHAGLFTAERVRDLMALAESGGPRARNLARYAAEGHLRLAGAEPMTRIVQGMRTPMAGGLTLPEVDAALADEPSPDRRREVQEVRLSAAHDLTIPALDVSGLRTMAASALGGHYPPELVAAAAGIDLGEVARIGAAVLDATDDAVEPALERLAEAALGLNRERVDAADLPRIVRAPHIAGALPEGGAREALERTCELLGVTVPDVTSTSRGFAGYSEVLRLGGRTAATAGAAARLPVEARLLGDPAIAGATGILFEEILTEAPWLVRVLHVADPVPVVVTARDIRLLATRVTCAQAVTVVSGDSVELMSRALGIEWPEDLEVLHGLSELAAADAIRARVLAAVLRRHLREASGDRWFADPRSGSFLREIWLEGGDLTPESIARDIGAELDAAALIDEVG